jgi:NAD(P)-dependent dehydrogenase (short-subunit alcohol dehydrogenase family)
MPAQSPPRALEDRVAVIIGATSGIGARSAELFVGEGARVVIAGRRVAEGRTLARALGDAAAFVRADVRSEDDVEALIRYASTRFGRLDCLFNNAGTPAPSRDIAHVDVARFDDACAVHLRGTLLGIKHAAPVMARAGGGSIINTASINGTRAGMTGVAYSTAKAAVIHLTRCAAVELGEVGVRVNSLSPGPIATGIFAKGFGLDDAVADGDEDTAAAALATITRGWQPLRRQGTTEDIARAALFLASDASAFVTGHDLVVDGGTLAGRPAAVMRAESSLLAERLRGR